MGDNDLKGLSTWIFHSLTFFFSHLFSLLAPLLLVRSGDVGDSDDKVYSIRHS